MTQAELNKLWNAVTGELEQQLTRATYHTLFDGARLVKLDEGVATIAVRNEYAREWVSFRLADVVAGLVSAIHGASTAVLFVVDDLVVSPLPTRAADDVYFVGFEPYQSNFVQMPRQFFEIVVPAGPAVVTAFVAAVADQTIGRIVNFRTNERREWWTASYPQIQQAAGLGSPSSVAKAVYLSRKLGYVIRKVDVQVMSYRLRGLGEMVDAPGDKPVDK